MIDDTPESDEPDEPQILDETPDAANPASVKRQRKKAEIAAEQSQIFWRAVMADKIGRKMIWGLLTDCGTFEARFGMTPVGFSAPEKTWFDLGQREIGQRIYRTVLLADHQATYQMHLEHDPEFPKDRLVKRTT